MAIFKAFMTELGTKVLNLDHIVKVEIAHDKKGAHMYAYMADGTKEDLDMLYDNYVKDEDMTGDFHTDQIQGVLNYLNE